VARITAVLFRIQPDSPFDDSSYYVWLSRLSEADWLRYLGPPARRAYASESVADAL
jgi:hypothetical protein